MNEYPNTVALHEPISPELFDGRSDPVEVIEDCAIAFRETLLKAGTAVSKQLDGKIPSNPVSGDSFFDRKESVSLGEISPDKPLTPDFVLAIKHNALFTAFLPELQQRFEVFCIVRNPLPVLASWQSIDLPVSRGTIPMAERFDSDLSLELAQADSLASKHLLILRWFYDRFRNQAGLIRYEDVIVSGGGNLAMVAGESCDVSDKLSSQYGSGGVAPEHLKNLADQLLQNPEVYRGFYSEGDILGQLEDMLD